MMYGISHSFYLFVFLKCVGIGFMIGGIYLVFMILRRVFSFGKMLILIQDLIFFVIAAIITFLCMFYINAGVMRFYLFAGEGIGFGLFYLLPGKTIAKRFHTLRAFLCRRNLQKLISSRLKKNRKNI